MSLKKEADSTTNLMADKSWVYVQKKTFTNWVNNKLKDTEVHTKDLHVDLKDGIVLITLMKVLAPGKKMPGRYKVKPKMDIHKRENLTIVFQFMIDVEKIPLVNIGPMDIYQCNLKLILGLIWTLILRYQIAGPINHEPADKKEVTKGEKKEQASAKRLLVNWVQIVIPSTKVTNFSSDWNDGLVLSALVDYCKPGLIPNHSSLNPSNGLENIKNAMDIAEKELGVPQVMHPEDMAVDKPDELSVMTYVSGFSHQDSAGQRSLLIWINLQMPHHQVTNLSSDWTDGTALGALTDVLSGGQMLEYETMTSETSTENCKIAMSKARELLGIELLISPEEFSSPTLNQLTRISYLAQFQFCSPKSIVDSLSITGKGVTGDIVGKETTFTASAPRLPKWVTIQATVRTASGKEIQVTKQSQENTSVKFSYTPDNPGEYVIDILVNKIPLPQHRAKHIVPIHASKCNASGDGLKRACVGKRAEFTVDCEQGGVGQLEVIVQGPHTKPTITIDKTETQTFNVSYTPEEGGPHSISINWGSEQIPDSPFQCTTVDPSKCKVTGLSHAVVNTRQSFIVDTSNAGPGELSVKCRGPSGELPVDITDHGKGAFQCTWIPQQMGLHKFDISFSSHPIPNNPFQVNTLAYADAQKCTVSNLPEGELFVKNTYALRVDTNQPGYTCNLTISPLDEGGLVSCEVETDNNGRVYNVQFAPAVEGKLAMDLKCNGASIPSSPFLFDVIDLSKPIKEVVDFQVMENIEETVNISAEFLSAEVEPTTENQMSEEANDMVLEISEPLTLIIDLESKQMSKNITATVTGEQTKPFNIPVERNANNSITVQLSPEKPDRYAIELKADGEPLPTGPFFVTYIESIKVRAPSESQTVTWEPPKERVIKVSSKYQRKAVKAQVSLSVDSSLAETCSSTSVSVQEADTATLVPNNVSELAGGHHGVEFMTTDEKEYTIVFKYHLKILPFNQDKQYILSVIA